MLQTRRINETRWGDGSGWRAANVARLIAARCAAHPLHRSDDKATRLESPKSAQAIAEASVGRDNCR